MATVNAHRRVSPKSEDSTDQFAPRLFIVVFGTRVERVVDVQRTEGDNPLPHLFPPPFGYFYSA